MRKLTGPSPDSAVAAWIVLLVGIFLFVLIYDLWAHFSGHLTMTSEFRNWLKGPVSGPVTFALWVAIPAGLSYHFFVHGR